MEVLTTPPIFNVTTTVSNTGEGYERSKVVELVYLGIVELLILVGNALVILAFIKGHRSIKTYTNYFVVNLAVSDLMVGCLSLPFWISLKLEATNAELNRYFIPLDLVFGTTSIYSLAVISVERMYAVKYPARHYNLSSRPVYFSIALTWIVSGILLGVHFAYFEGGPKDLNKLSTTVFFVVAFAVPLVVIFVSYTILFVAVAKLTKADNQSKSMAREIRIAKTISVIIGLFIVCWAPFFVLNILYAHCRSCLDEKSIDTFTTVAKALHYSNSMMNFFVYAVRSQDFRQTFRALLCVCNTKEIRERVRLLSVSVNTRHKHNNENENGRNKNNNVNGRIKNNNQNLNGRQNKLIVDKKLAYADIETTL